ncbi:hypothetical protein SNEBB_006450 [Seison nebaliae]|nr:hypothetical protein SNEBB_006450 [Seison nebaliae]
MNGAASVNEADNVIDMSITEEQETKLKRKNTLKLREDNLENIEDENDRSEDKEVEDVSMMEEKKIHTNLNRTKEDKILIDMSNNKSSDNILCSQTQYIIIPSYSAWFDYNSINAIEQRGLPEFFTSKNKSKSPEIYMNYRNFMIDTYRLNPNEYLTFTACRRNLAGDVCAILRVFSCLEEWGLINYQVDSDLRPTLLQPPSTAHFSILADTPSGLMPLTPEVNQDMDEIEEDENVQGKMTNDKTKEELNGNKENEKHFEVDEEKSELFHKALEDNEQLADKWTKPELLLLLEGIELFGEDWNRISDHVGNRSQKECILKFLQMPITDGYKNEKFEISNNLFNDGNEKLPFSQSANPVMSVVAFLASVVDPRIAAAASQAALAEFESITQESISRPLRRLQLEKIKNQLKNGKKLDIEIFQTKEDVAQNNSSNQSNKKKEDNDIDMESGKKENNVEEKVKDKSNIDKGKKKNEKSEKIELNEMQQEAAGVALAASVVKARAIAETEKRHIQSIVTELVELQMKKLDLKLEHFEELENYIENEKQIIEIQQQQLINDRQRLYMELNSATKYDLQQPNDIISSSTTHE